MSGVGERGKGDAAGDQTDVSHTYKRLETDLKDMEQVFVIGHGTGRRTSDMVRTYIG